MEQGPCWADASGIAWVFAMTTVAILIQYLQSIQQETLPASIVSFHGSIISIRHPPQYMAMIGYGLHSGNFNIAIENCHL